MLWEGRRIAPRYFGSKPPRSWSPSKWRWQLSRRQHPRRAVKTNNTAEAASRWWCSGYFAAKISFRQRANPRGPRFHRFHAGSGRSTTSRASRELRPPRLPRIRTPTDPSRGSASGKFWKGMIGRRRIITSHSILSSATAPCSVSNSQYNLVADWSTHLPMFILASINIYLTRFSAKQTSFCWEECYGGCNNKMDMKLLEKKHFAFGVHPHSACVLRTKEITIMKIDKPSKHGRHGRARVTNLWCNWGTHSLPPICQTVVSFGTLLQGM